MDTLKDTIFLFILFLFVIFIGLPLCFILACLPFYLMEYMDNPIFLLIYVLYLAFGIATSR